MIKITLYNGGPDFGKATPIHLETFPYFKTEENATKHGMYFFEEQK